MWLGTCVICDLCCVIKHFYTTCCMKITNLSLNGLIKNKFRWAYFQSCESKNHFLFWSFQWVLWLLLLRLEAPPLHYSMSNARNAANLRSFVHKTRRKISRVFWTIQKVYDVMQSCPTESAGIRNRRHDPTLLIIDQSTILVSAIIIFVCSSLRFFL